MNKQYLFTEKLDTPTNELFVAEAKTESEAYKKVAKASFRSDKIFISHMSGRTVNMSFAERFWLQTKEEKRVFYGSGEIIIDEQEFINRVKSYFSLYPKAGDEYLSYWFLDGTDEEIVVKFINFMDSFEEFFIKEWIEFSDYELIDISTITKFK